MARVCMSSNSQIGRMRNLKVFRFLLLYNILETVYRVVQATDSRTQAFIQVNGDLRYLMDGVSVQMQEFIKAEDASAVSFTDLEDENLDAYASPVAFHPLMLEFNTHPVGMPHMEHVVIKNLSPDTSIHMLSISGNTLHFHCSFFQEKVIPPGGNTSFDVVFLARQEGPVENTLFIHTSLGSFKYQVTAIGTANPYRLRPFVGVRMPLNSSYSPVIHMHNPYSSTLQLTEMYTSGGDLHLELPDGENDAPRKIWEIPPYETKPIVKANFIARIEKNHTCFIRIRTNGSNPDYLILPVEVDVTSAPGIYSPAEVLDFGILRSQDSPKVLSLSLLNSGQKHIHIMNVIVTPVNEAVDVKFVPVKVPPDTVFSTQIATITFNPSKVLHLKQCSGKIVVKSKNNQFKLHIPYQVQLIKGFLHYNKSCTRFYVGQEHRNNKIDVRELNITNHFNVTIIIYSTSLPDEAKPHFKVNIKEPIILDAGQIAVAAWLTFQPSYRNLQLTTYLRLHTNISYFDVPLLCFSGRLKVFLPHDVNESLIDFGTLGMGDKRTMIFAVINENPVDVILKLWGSNASKTYVELVGIDKGNASTLAWHHNFSAMARSLVLKPQHYAIFRIGITAPSHEGIFNGQAFVETQYEKIIIPFSLRTAKGGLKVDEIFFENAFPGKISIANLYVHSTFSHSMTVTGVTAIPEDERFSFVPINEAPSVLYPNSKNLVGKIQFDLRNRCKQKCYSSLPASTSLGHQWLLGTSLPPDLADIDKELFKTLYNRWQNLIELEGKSLNITLRLDTTEVRGHILKAHATLQWPRLFTKNILKFPITQIGNTTVKDFSLNNPSNVPIIVQLVPFPLYPKPKEVMNLLIEWLGGKLLNLKHITDDPDIFTLVDLEQYNTSPGNPIPAYRKGIEESYNVQPHKQTIALIFTPGMRVRIKVGFTPKDEFLRSSLILIRNNLTILDAFFLQGQGGHAEITFGAFPLGSDSSLYFELNEKLLKDCESKRKLKYLPPTFTVRRAVTAKNTGDLPIYIKGFDINGIECVGYGFSVLNCEGFELKPNDSRKVNLAFTPDFTLSRVERTLNIHTSQGTEALPFTMVALVPRHMLAFCYQALPRPSFENAAYLSFLFISLSCFVGVLGYAYMDSNKMISSTFFPFATIGIHTEKIEKGSVFDLKALSSFSMEPNSMPKANGYHQADVKKKKDVVDQENIPPDNYAASSHKGNANIHISKTKELTNFKFYDEHFTDNSVRHFKRKAAKSRQNLDNYTLEPELVEIKKSQPRNSWTRFLKPPFSFHSNSGSTNKPSVGTQTSHVAGETNLEDLDIVNEQDLGNLINCDSNVKNKTKLKKDCKYIDSKNQSKKNNDVLPEEETSSTTTESSTTESDISEKDHRLPDVCVTAKPQKSRISKNKARDCSLDCEAMIPLKAVNDHATDGEGFELSTKSKGHKKIKVDPSKVFGGDILRPCTLELPYKPKPVILERKKGEKSVTDDSPAPYKMNLHSSFKSKANVYVRRNSESNCKKTQKFNNDKCIKAPSSVGSNERHLGKDCPPPVWDYPLVHNHDESLTDLVQQTENFALRQGYRRCLWPSSSTSENSQTHLPRPNTYSTYPSSSYSAVLSRDITSKNKEKNTCGSVKNCMTTYKNSGLVKQQRSSVVFPTMSCNQINHSVSPPNAYNPTTLPSFNPAHCTEDLSGSKLKNWTMHSNSEFFASSSVDHSVVFKKEDAFNPDIRSSNDLSDTFCTNTSSIWSSQPVSMMQALKEERRHRLEEYRKQIAVYNDWPGFDLPFVEESLWDSNYNPPVDSWASDNFNNGENQYSSAQALKPEQTAEDTWNKSTQDSCWGNVSKLWSAPSCDNVFNSIDDSNACNSPASGSTSVDSKTQNCDKTGEFDPFHTLSTLWIPQQNNPSDPAESVGSSPWSFSLFSQPSSPAISENSQSQDKKEDEIKEAKPDSTN